MKIVAVVAFLGVSVMLVMVYQAVRQELDLRILKAHMSESSIELRQKEHDIVEEKNKIQELNKQLAPLNKKKDELNQKKIDLSRSVQQITNSLLICNTDKEVAERKKGEATKSIAEVKAEHEKAKTVAEQEIQQLKKQIFERDQAICTFVDETKEEGRKLCENAKAQQ